MAPLQCEQVLTAQRIEEVRERLSIVSAEKEQRLLAIDHLAGRISTADDSLSLLSDTFQEFRASLHHLSESPAAAANCKSHPSSKHSSIYPDWHTNTINNAHRFSQSRSVGTNNVRKRGCTFSVHYDAQPVVQRPLESFRAHACVSVAEALSPLVQRAAPGRSQCEIFLQSIATVKRIKAEALQLQVRLPLLSAFPFHAPVPMQQPYHLQSQLSP